jgi:hypothetical protein
VLDVLLGIIMFEINYELALNDAWPTGLNIYIFYSYVFELLRKASCSLAPSVSVNYSIVTSLIYITSQIKKKLKIIFNRLCI